MSLQASALPLNTWTVLARDSDGARRHSAVRYAGDAGFLLWGYLSYDVFIYGGPHVPRTDPPEYDVVALNPNEGRWRSHLPFEKEAEWSHALPPHYMCQSYHGITTGHYRPQLKVRDGVLRPDLTIVFDQVAFDTKRRRMVYFAGGRTFAYDVARRTWSAIDGPLAPPPVLGGSLCYDPFNDEFVLTGGGHVAEPGPDGKAVGYTGTWIYACTTSAWRALEGPQPPPRMASRLACDADTRSLVLFGGDAQTHWLGDTWIYDTRTRSWRQSAAPGPPPRAGHFVLYDSRSEFVLIGGGYNRQDLSDMWAYSVSDDRWTALRSDVPVGWYITADIDPSTGLIVLCAATESKQFNRRCDELFLNRTTWGLRLDAKDLVDGAVVPVPHDPMPRRPPEQALAGTAPDHRRRAAQTRRLAEMLPNRWVLLSDPGRPAPLRTWGSCSFDTDRGRIIYWGGGHCGYGGNDYDFYDVAENTWVTGPLLPDYPSRSWNRGINLAGVSFSGAPWVRHGRKIYAYDPVSRRVVNTKLVFLTACYDPPPLRSIEPLGVDFGSGEDFTASGYAKWTTWTFDPDASAWDLVCSGKPGLDLTVSTPHGVMAVDHNWGAVGSDDRPDQVLFEGRRVVENAVFLLDVAGRRWRKLSGAGPWPQNLYEMTALVHDTKRDRLLLHGAGADRDELWAFDISGGGWSRLNPRVETPDGILPVCRREAVYLPGEDALLTCAWPVGNQEAAGVFVYRAAVNAWERADIPPPEGRTMADVVGQNRAVAHDPERNLILMVLGEGRGNQGHAVVYALRYRR